jgi:hypothetical protein
MTLDDLIEQSCDAAAADPAWLGSDAHLTLLTEALEPVFGLTDATLEWAAPGEPGFWERATRRVSLERPILVPGRTAEQLAKLTALGLLHESLHARYSSSFGSFPARKLALDQRLWRPTDRLFNVLEDGRVNGLGAAADPELTSYLTDFADIAVDQAARYAGKNGPGTSPASARNQLFFAVEAYALRPDQPQPLNPAVKQALSGLAPQIDSTKTGTTEDCGITAIQVVGAIINSTLPS